MTPPRKFFRQRSAEARLADLLLVSRRDARKLLAPPTAHFGDTPGWSEDALQQGPDAPEVLLTLDGAADLVGLKKNTLVAYRASDRFILPAAVLLPRKTYGYPPAAVLSWKRDHGDVARGRPLGSRTSAITPGPRTVRYLSASLAATELEIARSSVAALIQAGEFPAHDAMIGSRRVWLPATIAEFRVFGRVESPTEHPTQFLTTPDIAPRLNMSDVAIRTAVNQGRFPAPDALAGRAAGWAEATVESISREWRRPSPREQQR